MTQAWTDLLFAHWALPVEALRALVPPQLEIDRYDGRAWLGVVPFGMTRVYPRGTFPVPWVSHFLELNVRTYVKVGGQAGVYFFSLDAANPLAVEVARRWYRLPYYNARMRIAHDGDTRVYASQRTHRGAPPAEFRARYRPTGEVYNSRPGTLEAWLTERYCLYTVSPRGDIFRGDIHHAPWPLQPAEAEIETNSMAQPYGLVLPDEGRRPAVLHFCKWLDTLEWPIRRAR